MRREGFRNVHRTKGHCVEYMFLCVAHGGDGQIQDEERHAPARLRAPIVERLGEEESHRVQEEAGQWYRSRWMEAGREGVKQDFLASAGAVAQAFGWKKELLAPFYEDLASIAGADHVVTLGEEALLRDVAAFWGLSEGDR